MTDQETQAIDAVVGILQALTPEQCRRVLGYLEARFDGRPSYEDLEGIIQEARDKEQAARALDDRWPKTDMQHCPECSAYFEHTINKRSDAKFCSPACRLRAHRKRQKEHAVANETVTNETKEGQGDRPITQ